MGSDLRDLIRIALDDVDSSTVPDPLKLHDKRNYKDWARLTMKSVLHLNCFLEMYLNNQFREIPGVSNLDSAEQERVRMDYEKLTSSLVRIYIDEPLFQVYVVHKGLRGLELWDALYNDLGHFSFAQQLHFHSELHTMLHDPKTTMLEKLALIQYADPDILPVSDEYKFVMFATVCGNSAVKDILVRLHHESDKVTWKALKEKILDISDKEAVSDTYEAVSGKPPPRILIRSNVNCSKCGGVGHKSDVCVSMDDEERIKLEPVSGKVNIAPDSFPKDEFYLDSRVSHHITHQKKLLHNFSRSSGTIKGHGALFRIAGSGSLKFKLPDGSSLTLTDVQYVPSFGRNLVSILQVNLRGTNFTFNHNKVMASDLGIPVASLIVPEHVLLYQFSLPCVPPSS